MLAFQYKNSSCHSRLGYPLPQNCRNWPECGYHTQHDLSHVPYDLFQHHWCQGLWFRHLAFYLHYFRFYQMSRSYVTCQVSSYFRHQIATNCVYKPPRCRFLDHSCPKDVITVKQSILWSYSSEYESDIRSLYKCSDSNTSTCAPYWQVPVEVYRGGPSLYGNCPTYILLPGQM